MSGYCPRVLLSVLGFAAGLRQEITGSGSELQLKEESDELLLNLGAVVNFQRYARVMASNQTVHVLALGESTTDGRYPPGCNTSNFRYQDKFIHHLQHMGIAVELETIAAGGCGICCHSDNLFVRSGKDKQNLLSALHRADLLLLQTSSNDKPWWAGNVSQCMEDVVARTDATSIWLDFYGHSMSHEAFYSFYNATYISVPSILFDGHHPNEESMTLMTNTLIPILEVGVKAFHAAAATKVSGKQLLVANHFGHAEKRHWLYRIQAYKLSNVQSSGWTKCDSPWPSVCRPEGFSYTIPDSDSAEGAVQPLTFGLNLEHLLTNQSYKLAAEFVHSYEYMGRARVVLSGSGDLPLCQKEVDTLWADQFSIPISTEICVFQNEGPLQIAIQPLQQGNGRHRRIQFTAVEVY